MSAQAQTWKTVGPGPLLNGQSEGIVNNPVIGAIHGIAPHPVNADILYVATVNGGIWKTSNATSASPSWLALSDDLPSLSMGDIEFDITDANHQTLIAGFGKFSSLGRVGGSRAGVLHTTDGGDSWTQLNGGMLGRNITSVEARGSILLATADIADNFTCGNIGLFRSTNTGVNWTQISTAQGLTTGAASALTSDPSNPSVFYTGIHNFDGICSALASGIYKSIDTGASWTKISDAAMDAVISNQFCHFEITVGSNNNVFTSMVCSDGELSAVFYSANGGDSWAEMGLPGTIEIGGFAGIHPGGQGNTHSSLTADPNNHSIVYIGGDRQPSPLPNSINANDFSGRIFRGDASLPLAVQWTALTHINTLSNSAPHADSRELRFNANGNLLESDDGGIYSHSSPMTNNGDWISLNGNLKINEQHDTAYDTNSEIVISGNQDNGTGFQNSFASTTWEVIFGGDGGDVVIDNISLAGINQSIRYISIQNLAGLTRLVYDENNVFQSFATVALELVKGEKVELDPQFVTPLAINQVNGNRLVIGAENSVYESFDQGDTISEIGPGIAVLGFGRGNIAYGSMGNEDVLYVGACQGACDDEDEGPDGVFVRSTSEGLLTHVYTPPNGAIRGITVNPNNPAEAFLIENTQVMHTINTGSSWTNITGNLPNIGLMRSIVFMPDDVNNGIAIGTNLGVYIAKQSTGYNDWASAASGMPNAPVFDLQYDQAEYRLIAGTLGRGAFTISVDLIFENGFEVP